MKKTIVLFAFTTTVIISAQQDKLPFQLDKKWELTGLQNPESVVLDPKNKVLYIYNVNGDPTDKDSNGYISKVGIDGKMIQQKWITNLNAPKGLTIYKNTLYIADIDEVIAVNITTKKREIFKVSGASFLNDIIADEKGNVYISNTFGFSAIYKLPSKGNRIVTLWLKNNNLNMPNGLSISKNKLIIASWGKELNPKTFTTKNPGNLLQVNLKNKEISTFSQPFGNLDGLSQTLHGYLITDWLKGTLYYYSNNKITEVIDLPQGSADTFFDKKSKTLYIPLMLDNKLLTYQFKK